MPEAFIDIATKTTMIKVLIMCDQKQEALEIFDIKPEVFVLESVNFHRYAIFTEKELRTLTDEESSCGICQLLADLIADNNPNMTELIVGNGTALKSFFLDKYPSDISVSDTNPGRLYLKRP